MKTFQRLTLILSLAPALALPASPAGEETATLHSGNVGPWGQLEWFEVALEPSDLVLSEPLYTHPPLIWAFPPDWSPDGIAAFLREGGVPEAEIVAMLAPENRRQLSMAVTVVPTEKAILSLTPETRATLYRRMAEWRINPYQSTPFSLGGDNVETLAGMASHPFSPEFIRFANQFVYRGEPKNVLSDYPLLCARLPDRVDVRLSLAKLLLRSRALMVRLRIPPGADPEEVRRYWTLDGRYDSGIATFDAAFGDASTEEAPSLDLVHLLPPLPRQFLNTYGTRALAVGDLRPDCFWTALNFFEDDISQRYLDPIIGDVLGNEWLPVDPPYRFGDLVLIHETDSDAAIHACNYLADGLVFTKNGKSLLRPWLIQHLDQVAEIYSVEGKHRTTFYRHRRFLRGEPLRPAVIGFP